MAMNFFVKVSKLSADGHETLDQWRRSVWRCSCTAPITLIDSRDQLPGFEDKSDGLLAEAMCDIDLDWRTGVEAVLAQELINAGIVDQFLGIAVFELVLFGRSGQIPNVPHRFYVFGAGGTPALYTSDNLKAAFAAAESIAKRGRVEDPLVTNLEWPTPPPKASSSPRL